MKRHMNYSVQLYIAGDNALSQSAQDNLEQLAAHFLQPIDIIEIINIIEEPGLAVEKRIIITPTLIRVQPLPEIRIVGDLSQIEVVALELGLK